METENKELLEKEFKRKYSDSCLESINNALNSTFCELSILSSRISEEW